MSNRRRVPRYRLHKPSGQAVATLSGRDHYLGPHGTQVSRDEYDRVVAEWLANGRRAVLAEEERPSLLVTELVGAYWRHAQAYYVKDGKPTGEQWHIKTMLRVVKKLYGRTPVAQFGPLALKACREELIAEGQVRRTINQNAGRIKRMFRWGVENEMVPGEVYHALRAVEGLKRGRSAAKESEGVKPVPEEHVEKVLPVVSAAVGAMIRVQLLTGMRPGEVVIMCGCDIDRSGRVWTYKPMRHKTEHFGDLRVVYLGPQAQKVLKPFLAGDRAGFLFSAAEAEEARQARRTMAGDTSRGSRGRTEDRARAWREHYDVDSYRRAITRACEAAKIDPWHPHRLRHSAATKLRKDYGIEAARVVLGHKSAAVTEIYAETDRARAAEVMAEVG